jgi:hypothetical protein
MTDLQKAMQELQKPFPAQDIEWRVQRVVQTTKGNKAVVLAYVTNRAIQNRLDEVFGIGNWKNEFKEWRENGVLCGISVKIDGEWVTKWDGAEETQIEAVKGGFSGSMKRAAVQWGIGRYLYNLEETWVDIKERGEHYISDKKTGIKGYWDTPSLPSWALPEEPKESKKHLLLAKWKTLKYPEEKFEEWYNGQIQKGHNDIQMEKYLTQKLMMLKENAS